MPTFYADSSAVVKLIREEPETAALTTFVDGAELVASSLILTEVPRAIHRAISTDRKLSAGALFDQTADVINALSLITTDDELLAVAGMLDDPMLRSLDAIHIASAAGISELDAFISYDVRQAEVARRAGLRPVAPGTTPN